MVLAHAADERRTDGLAIYLPQPGGYPRWFVASVQRTLAGLPAPAGSPGNPNGTAGVRLAVTGQVLMVFEQVGKTSPWLLAPGP